MTRLTHRGRLLRDFAATRYMEPLASFDSLAGQENDETYLIGG